LRERLVRPFDRERISLATVASAATALAANAAFPAVFKTRLVRRNTLRTFRRCATVSAFCRATVISASAYFTAARRRAWLHAPL